MYNFSLGNVNLENHLELRFMSILLRFVQMRFSLNL